MIEFRCATCGNHFRVQSDVAGRHGWCKICHGFILVPTLDQNGAAEPVTLHDRERRLEQLLREASARYERLTFKIALIAGKYKDSKEKLAAADAAQSELTGAKTRVAQLEAVLVRQTSDLHDATSALGDAKAEIARLNVKVAEATDEIRKSRTGVSETSPTPVAAVHEAATSHATSTTIDIELAQRSVDLARVTTERNETIAALRRAESLLSEAQARYDNLVANMEDKSRALGAYESRAETDQREIARLTAELVAARDSLSELEPRTAQLARDAARVGSLDRERADLAERLEKSEAQLDALRTELTGVALNSENASSRAAQAALELDRLHTAAQEAETARATTELALREALIRAERAEAQAAALAGRAEALEKRADRAQGLEDELRSATARMGELESLLARLTPDLTAASQALGAYESRAEQTARELERLKTELKNERQAKTQTDAALREAELGYEGQDYPSLDPRTEAQDVQFTEDGDDDDLDLDDGELTLVPEILDDNDAEQTEMVNVLLRFLEPENDKKGS